MTKAKYEEGPSPTKKQKTVNDEKPAHQPLSLSTDLGGKVQKYRTDEIVDIIDTYRQHEFPELTINQLLGYLIFREKRQTNKVVSEVGKKLFEETLSENDAFTTDEEIAFKQNLTLSREQIRKTRHVLQNQKLHFPTSNELNAERKKLRPDVATTLGDKRSDAASSKSALKVTFNFIQNLGGGGQYGDPSSFKEGHLVVQKTHTLRKIRWCKGIR